jgi:hypothetical protein
LHPQAGLLAVLQSLPGLHEPARVQVVPGSDLAARCSQLFPLRLTQARTLVPEAVSGMCLPEQAAAVRTQADWPAQKSLLFPEYSTRLRALWTPKFALGLLGPQPIVRVQAEVALLQAD